MSDVPKLLTDAEIADIAERASRAVTALEHSAIVVQDVPRLLADVQCCRAFLRQFAACSVGVGDVWQLVYEVQMALEESP